MIQENFNYSGFLVRLFNKPPEGLPFSPKYQFYALGYYDGIKVENVSDLKSYFIHNSRQKKRSSGKNEIELCDFEEQRLCLYLPKDLRGDIFQYKKGKPFIVIIQINFDVHEKPITYGQMQSEINSILLKFNGLEKELFSSLGFSDYVLVSRMENIDLVNQIILEIRGMTVNDQKVRSTYTVIGFAKNQVLSEKFLDQTVNASLRIGLLDRNSYANLHATISNSLGVLTYSVAHLVGRYDEEISLFKVSIKELLGLFVNTDPNHPPLLDPIGSLYNDNIRYTNTRLLLDNQERSIDNEKENLFYNTVSKNATKKQPTYLVGSARLINVIDFLEKNELLPESSIISLNRLIRIYLLTQRPTISDGRFGDNLHVVMEDLFTLILFDLGFTEKTINKIFEHGFIKAKALSSPDLDTLEESISIIADHIHAQTQGSSHIFESPAFNSKFVGSSKGILSVYSTIVEAFQDSINGFTNPMSNNFITTIDNSMKIMSTVLFPAASFESKKKLTAISLDISSFFDLRTGIPYVIHEIGHGFFYFEAIDYACQIACKFFIQEYFFDHLTDEFQDIGNIIPDEITEVNSILAKRIEHLFLKKFMDGKFDITQLQNQKEVVTEFALSAINELLVNEGLISTTIVDNVFQAFENSQETLKRNGVDELRVFEFLNVFQLHENTDSNKEGFRNNFSRFLSENAEKLSYYFFLSIKFISETCADFLMVKALNMNQEEYIALEEDNLKKQFINLKGETANELEARRRVLFPALIEQHFSQNTYDPIGNYLKSINAVATIEEKCDKILNNTKFQSHVGFALKQFDVYFPSKQDYSKVMAFIDFILKKG